MTGASDDALVAVLTDAQRLGFLGARPIPEVIEHARGFVRALEHVPPIRSVLDLGSGGGIPGFVIAHDRPDLELTLLDRRSKRTDFLERAVRRLGWQERVDVLTADAAEVAGDVVDAIVARGFGPPAETLRVAARLVRPGGSIIISEPPREESAEDRWDTTLLGFLDLERRPAPPPETDLAARVAIFVRG